jgi:hypothetical protein
MERGCIVCASYLVSPASSHKAVDENNGYDYSFEKKASIANSCERKNNDLRI